MTDDQRLIEDHIPVQAINSSPSGRRSGTPEPTRASCTCGGLDDRLRRHAPRSTRRSSQCDGTPDEARSADFFIVALPVGRERPDDRRGPRAGARRQRRRAAEGARPVRRRRRDPARGRAARMRRDRCRAQPCRAPHRALHARLPAALRASLADDIREYGAPLGPADLGARRPSLPARAREPQGEQQRTRRRIRPPTAARRADRSPTSGRARCRARTPRAARTMCRSCVRPGWRRRRAGSSRSSRSSTARALTVDWEVVEAESAEELGFDPAGFSSRGKASCLVCGATGRRQLRQGAGPGGKMGITPLAAVVVKPSGRGRDYLAGRRLPAAKRARTARRCWQSWR